MLDTIFASVRRQIDSWNDEVKRRREMSSADSMADAIEFCASEMSEQIRLLEDESEWLTPDQFGETKGVSGQAVRNWIRRGELKAEETAKGYRIPRRAERTRRRPGRAPSSSSRRAKA